MEERSGGVATDGVDAEAQLALEVGADDVDCARGIVAVDEQVCADRLVVGQTEAVFGLVDDGDCF